MTLFTSIITFVVTGYDRYVAICSFKANAKAFEDTQLNQVIAGAWVLALVVSCLPFLGVGRYALQPSGQYCNQDFFDPTSFAIIMGMIFISSCAIVFFYGNVLYKIYSTVSNVGGSAGSASQKKQEKVAVSLAILVVFFVGCWTPALVMGVVHVAKFPFAEDPVIDILAA